MRLLEPAGDVRLRLAAAGDVGVIGRARARARAHGFDAVLSAATPAFTGADLAFANLEFPIGAPSELRSGRSPEFRHDVEIAAALVRAGVRVVSLANNHMMDCGEAGLRRTREACAAAGLEAVGAGDDLEQARRPARMVVRGQRVVVLAYATPSEHQARPARAGVAPLEAAVLREDLARWRPEADVLVVSAHWGSMYVDYPPPHVLELADLMARAGVDVILGGHPHVTQGWRRRGRTLTLFSLGDLVLDPAAGDFEARVATERRRESGVFTALIAESPGLEVAPLTLDADGVPGPAGTRAAAQRARLERLSAGLDHAAERWAAEGAPVLLRYELQSLGSYLRQGRLDRIARLIGALRPRHLPLLWQAVRRPRSAA